MNDQVFFSKTSLGEKAHSPKLKLTSGVFLKTSSLSSGFLGPGEDTLLKTEPTIL